MPSILAAAGLAGAGFAGFHAENAWMFAASSALLLAGGFWVSVLHHRTTAGAVTFLVAAALVSIASSEWPLTALSASLGVLTAILVFRDSRAKRPAT